MPLLADAAKGGLVAFEACDRARVVGSRVSPVKPASRRTPTC